MCKRKHWRKTFQWISLTREHAELIAWEQEINKGFRDLCHPHINLKLGRFVSCSDNEHYPPVVLAAHDVGHETTCWPGGTTYVDWRIPDLEGRPRYVHRVVFFSANHISSSTGRFWLKKSRPACCSAPVAASATLRNASQRVRLTSKSTRHCSRLRVALCMHIRCTSAAISSHSSRR